MDPNETLRELRALAERVNCGDEGEYELSVKAARMAELFDALDEWIMKGGFLPVAWSWTPPRAANPSTKP